MRVNKCPITYQPCENKYNKKGLAQLSSRLTELNDLPYTAQEQRHEAGSRAVKMSIQGFQPKLSAKLSVKDRSLNIVESCL